MKKSIAILSILLVTLFSTACNTMKGFGKDVQHGGEKIQNSATNVQNGSATQDDSSR